MTLGERLRALKQGTRDHQWMSQAEKLALIDVALAAGDVVQALDNDLIDTSDIEVETPLLRLWDTLTALAGVLGGDAS